MLRLVCLVGVLAALVGATANAAGTGWMFTPDEGTRLPEGVSTEVIQLGDGSLLAYANTLHGQVAYRSADGLSFTQVSAHLPPGNDPAVVPLADGRLRMYYVVCNPCNTLGKEIRSATSSNGLDWTPEPGVRFALTTSRAGGVPDAVVLPNGDVRIYYVPSLDSEAVDSATSHDGLAFTADAGHRLNGGYVDPAVLRLADGTWLMIVSRTPRERQRLFLAHSSDALSWTVDGSSIYQPAGGANALDPTPVALADGRIRVYYSEAAAGRQLSGPYVVRSGVLAATTLDTLSVSVKGKGTVRGGSISCPGRCSASLADGASTTLTATPAKGYRLKSWSGACSSARATCRITLHGDAATLATFLEKP